jgi:hypothetical protein
MSDMGFLSVLLSINLNVAVALAFHTKADLDAAKHTRAV